MSSSSNVRQTKLPRAVEGPLTFVNVSPNEWRREGVRLSLRIGAQQADYKGPVLKSSEAASHRIEFEINSSSLRKTLLDLPLVVSTSSAEPVTVSASLCVRDKEVGQYEFVQANDEPILRRIRKEITKHTEASASTRGTLDLFYGGQTAVTSILIDQKQPDLHARVVTRWKWNYALPSALFFSLAWLNLLGLAFLILVHLRALGDSFRFYAALTAAVAWILQVTVMSNVKQLSLKPILRQLYAKTAGYRGYWLVAVATLFIVVAASSGVILYALSIRYQYSRLIGKALDGTDGQKISAIEQAFLLVPWRKEAQILCEERAYNLRDTLGTTAQDAYIKDFTERVHPSISALRSEAPPFYLSRHEGATFDPIVWYSSLIGDIAEPTEHNYQPIFDLLNRNQSGLARLEAQFFKFHLSSILASKNPDDGNLKKQSSDAVELRRLLIEVTSDLQAKSSFQYQQAYDALGTYELIVCFERHLSVNDEDLEQAKLSGQLTQCEEKSYGDYKQVLDARRGLRENSTIWHQPPDKLDIFQLLCEGCGQSVEGQKRRLQLIPRYGYSYCRIDGRREVEIKNQLEKAGKFAGKSEDESSDLINEECGKVGLLKRLLQTYPKFDERNTWMAGTVKHGDIKTYIRNTMLNEGWAY